MSLNKYSTYSSLSPPSFLHVTASLVSTVTPRYSLLFKVQINHENQILKFQFPSALNKALTFLFVDYPDLDLRPASNHLFICLMTSILIYKKPIYMAKNESLIVGLLSALTAENVSGGPPGTDGPPAAMRLLGTICHHPSEPMISMCWSHSLRCGLGDAASFSKPNTICHVPAYLHTTCKTFISRRER